MTVSRRQLTLSAGAALLLAPFLAYLNPRKVEAQSTKHAKRLILFCTMGTKPDLWKPQVGGEAISSFSQMTAPLAAVKDNIVLVDGMPAENVGNNHGAPDGITGMGNGYYAVNNVQQPLVSVDQFVADRLVKSGVNRPIASLLLGAETSNGQTMFYRAGKNIKPIASPASAFSTVFGAAMAPSPAPSNPGTGSDPGTNPGQAQIDALLKRRHSILDVVKEEVRAVENRVGSYEKAKLEQHLESIRALENKLGHASGSTGGGSTGGGSTPVVNEPVIVQCSTPAKPSDGSTSVANDLLHMDIIVNALACDITRVAAIELGTDQSYQVNLPGLQGEQHNGFIHSGAPNFANLIKFEAWMAEQFAKLITSLKSKADPNEAGKTLFDTTLVVWARDMGDSVAHNMNSMRFVLGGGAGGYLKTNASGRFVSSSARHERALLNIIEAMGFTDFSGFGDPKLAQKTPLSELRA